MKLADFDFELPSALIAQKPCKKRADSRLLVGQKPIIDTVFSDIGNFLTAGDLLVLNNTKVINARLYANKQSGGGVEIMLERILPNNQALAMIKASQAPKIDSILNIENNYQAKVLTKKDYLYRLRFNNDVYQILTNCGHVPLPPYIKRSDNKDDKKRYQTIFARYEGAIASPTAGLHFDANLLQVLQQKGIYIAELTLHIGIGTFSPIKTNNIKQHKMHTERIIIPSKTQKKILAVKQNNKRIIAVGTTVVRALEAFATIANKAYESDFIAETDIFIYPGFDFKLVDGLITNFHLPKSTLLLLVSAFAGIDNIKDIYQYAIKGQYRFFSYGDAMLLSKQL